MMKPEGDWKRSELVRVNYRFVRRRWRGVWKSCAKYFRWNEEEEVDSRRMATIEV